MRLSMPAKIVIELCGLAVLASVPLLVAHLLALG